MALKKTSTKTAVKKQPVKKAKATKPATTRVASRKKKGTSKKLTITQLFSLKSDGALTRKGILVSAGIVFLAVASFGAYALWQNLSADASGGGKRVFTNNTIAVNGCKAGTNPNGSIIPKWTVRNQLSSTLSVGFPATSSGREVRYEVRSIPSGASRSVTGGAFSSANEARQVLIWVKQGTASYRVIGTPQINMSALPRC